jgi:tetratricopeptide (TPR) repeat protein
MTWSAKQVAEIENPEVAYFMARSATLVLDSVVDPKLVAQWGELGITPEKKAWHLHVAGMAHFRAGDYEKALERLEQSAATNWHPELNQLGLALFYATQGDMTKAREYLQLAQKWFEEKETSRTDEYYSAQATDWLEAHLLLREAEKQITIE